MASWDTVADDATIAETVEALKNNGMDAMVVSTGAEAREHVLSLVPTGAEVMTMSSVTLEAIGLAEALNAPGRSQSVRSKLSSMNRDTDRIAMLKAGAAPEWTVGSVHAVSRDGHVVIASNTGSQLPAYVYASARVVWVVGAQKIVSTVEEGVKRIYEYVLPLESERARKVYGVPGSAVNKLLIINREVVPGRISIVLVKEKLGF